MIMTVNMTLYVSNVYAFHLNSIKAVFFSFVLFFSVYIHPLSIEFMAIVVQSNNFTFFVFVNISDFSSSSSS